MSLRSLPKPQLAVIAVTGLFAWTGIDRGLKHYDEVSLVIGCVAGAIMAVAVAALPRGVSRQRARRLLFSHLSEYQRLEFETHNSFTVWGSDGEKYLIRERWVGGVICGKYRYCAHPYDVPLYDAMLAQKLLIETDAPRFREHANRSYK